MRAGMRYILLFLSLIYGSLKGQEYLAPDVLSVEDGLLSNNVTSILFDDQGFLWAGTKNGLDRYNGYRFRPFFTMVASNGYPGIQTTLRIRTDNIGNLWILTSGGINSIDRINGEIERYPFTSFDTAFKPGSEPIDIYPSADGNLWILTDRSLTVLSPEKSFFTRPLPQEMVPNGTYPTSMAVDKRGNVWIGTTMGLLLFSADQEQFKEIVGPADRGLLSDNSVKSLYIDGNNYLWIGTAVGLTYADLIDYEFYRYYPAGSVSKNPSNNIKHIAASSNGRLLLSTSGGIIRFDPATQRFESVFSTTDTLINSVATDLKDNIWAATDVGIIKIRKSRIPILNISRKTDTQSDFRLAYDHITSLMVNDAGNRIFIGYNQDGFSVADTRTFTGNHFNTLDGSPVTGFYPFRSQEYLVSSRHDIELYTPAARRSRTTKRAWT